MNYKLLLFPLIVSTALINADNKSLREKILQKRFELSELRKQINELAQYTRNCFSIALTHTKEQYKFMGKELDTTSREAMGDLGASFDAFIEKYNDAKQDNKAAGFLVKELIGHNETWPDSPIDFDSPKFVWLSAIIEYRLLKELVADYDHKLEELVALEKQIDAEKV